MMDWLSDLAAGFGLVMFIGSAFVIANAAPIIMGTH